MKSHPRSQSKKQRIKGRERRGGRKGRGKLGGGMLALGFLWYTHTPSRGGQVFVTPGHHSNCKLPHRANEEVVASSPKSGKGIIPGWSGKGMATAPQSRLSFWNLMSQ